MQQQKTNRDDQEKGVPDGVGISAAIGFQVYLSQPVYGYLQSLESQSQEMTQSLPEFLILFVAFHTAGGRLKETIQSYTT